MVVVGSAAADAVGDPTRVQHKDSKPSIYLKMPSVAKGPDRKATFMSLAEVLVNRKKGGAALWKVRKAHYELSAGLPSDTPGKNNGSIYVGMAINGGSDIALSLSVIHSLVFPLSAAGAGRRSSSYWKGSKDGRIPQGFVGVFMIIDAENGDLVAIQAWDLWKAKHADVSGLDLKWLELLAGVCVFDSVNALG
jgi:hypothetical protein